MIHEYFTGISKKIGSVHIKKTLSARPCKKCGFIYPHPLEKACDVMDILHTSCVNVLKKQDFNIKR